MLRLARKQEVIAFLLVVETFSTANAQRNHQCTPDGSTCPNQYTDSVDSDSLWDEWSTWSSCSVTCGTGVKVRSRSCLVLDVGLQCEGPSHVEETCFLMACPNDKAGKPKSDDNDGDDAFTGESTEQGNGDQNNDGNGNHDDMQDDILDEDQHNNDGPEDNDGNYDENGPDDRIQDDETPNCDHHDDDTSPNTDSQSKSDEGKYDKDIETETTKGAANDEHDEPDDANDDTIGGDDLDHDDPDDTTQEKGEDAKPTKDGQENGSFGEDDDDGGQGEDDGQEDERDDGQDEKEDRKTRHTSTTSDQGERDADDNEDVSADDEPGGESGNDEDDEGDDDAEDDDDKSGGKKKRKRPQHEEEEDEEEEDKDEEEEKEKKKRKRRRKKKKKRKKRRNEKREGSENGDPVENTVVQEDTVILAEKTALCDQGTTMDIPRVVYTSSGLSSDPGQRESESPPEYSKSVSRSSSLYPVSQTSLDSTHSYLSQTGSCTSGEFETEDSSSSSWSSGDESDTSESYSSSSNQDCSRSLSDSVFSSGLSSPISMPGSPVDGPSHVTSGPLAGLFDLREQAAGLPPCRSDTVVSHGHAQTDIPESGSIMHPDPALAIQADSSSPRTVTPGPLPLSPISPIFSDPSSDLSVSVSPASIDGSYVDRSTKKRLQSTFIDHVDDEPETHWGTDASDVPGTSPATNLGNTCGDRAAATALGNTCGDRAAVTTLGNTCGDRVAATTLGNTRGDRVAATTLGNTSGDRVAATTFGNTSSDSQVNSSKYTLPARPQESIERECGILSDLDCISTADRPVQ